MLGSAVACCPAAAAPPILLPKAWNLPVFWFALLSKPLTMVWAASPMISSLTAMGALCVMLGSAGTAALSQLLTFYFNSLNMLIVVCPKGYPEFLLNLLPPNFWKPRARPAPLPVSLNPDVIVWSIDWVLWPVTRGKKPPEAILVVAY